MKIKIKCSGCGKKLRIPLVFKSLIITCPNCGRRFNFNLKLSNLLSSLFFRKNKPETEYSTYNYSINSDKKVTKLFLYWIIILVLMLFLVYSLKNCETGNNSPGYKAGDKEKVYI